MFFRDLKPKPNVTLRVALAEAYLPVKLGHRDADKVFAEPLAAQLAAAGLGTVMETRVTERRPGDIRGVQIFLGLTDISRPALRTVTGMFEALAAPHGSWLRLTDGLGEPLIFGVTEGLELSIGSDLAPDSEARRELAMACKDAMEHIGVSRGWAEQHDRTLFYFYGENFVDMKSSLSRALEGHPRFAAARLRRMA